MPIYKNTSSIQQKVSGIIFDPDEEKEVNCYLYDKDLELTDEAPAPVVIIKSGTFELMTDAEEEIALNNTEECMLDVIIQAPDGGIKLYHNSTDNLGIEFEGVYQDTLSSKYLETIIIVALKDNVKGSYFIKKVG